MHRAFVTASVVYIGVVISIAQLVAPGTYDWTRNTISDLGAQGYEHAWIMRLGFISHCLYSFVLHVYLCCYMDLL